MRYVQDARQIHQTRAPGLGAVVRNARLAQGLSLTELGTRVGYSASQVSRYERGITPLTDIALLRRFAAALGVAAEAFGLSGEPGGRRHAGVPAQTHAAAWSGHTVDHERREEDDVRRRELLAALPAAVLLPAARTSSSAGTLTDVQQSVRRGIAAGGPAGSQARDRLADAVRYYDQSFSLYPPAVLAAEVGRVRAIARQMLRQPQPDRSRRDLQQITGWLSALSGNLAFVLADNTGALIHLGTAARLGTAAGDDDLVCWSLGAQSMTACAQGLHAEALDLARTAYEYARTPLRRAQILAWARLRSLAGMGDQHRSEAARVMSMAQDQMAADPRGERPGRFGFDLAELALHLAEADLALGRPAQARAHALESAAHTTTGRPGWAAAVLVLARGEAARGNHGDAATLAHQVLDTISPQALRETSRARLRDLDADLFTGPAPSIAARDLRDRLRALPALG